MTDKTAVQQFTGIKAVAFDLDGTLTDSIQDWRKRLIAHWKHWATGKRAGKWPLSGSVTALICYWNVP